MTTQEAQKSAYQNRAAKSREKYQKELAEYNASKKAAAKADSAAPAAEGPPKKKRRKSEDGGEKKKVCFSVKRKRRPTFTGLRPTQKKKSKKKSADKA